jgi:hypothetical protein
LIYQQRVSSVTRPSKWYRGGCIYKETIGVHINRGRVGGVRKWMDVSLHIHTIKCIQLGYITYRISCHILTDRRYKYLQVFKHYESLLTSTSKQVLDHYENHLLQIHSQSTLQILSVSCIALMKERLDKESYNPQWFIMTNEPKQGNN